MLSSQLPNEILARILKELSLHDQKNCMLVNRSWNTQARAFVLQYVHVKTTEQFQHFIKQLDNKQEPLGPLIRKLRFGNKVELSQGEFDSLPIYCPNLECLDSEHDLWLYFNYTDNIERWQHLQYYPKITIENVKYANGILQHLGHSMSQLHIETGRTRISISNILLQTPNLKSLQLTETDLRAESVRMTVSKFESIHTFCQHLEALTLDGFACDLGANDVRHVEALPIATGLKTLRLVNVQIGNPIFLLYWGHKYQNIETLDINIGNLLLESPENLRMKNALATMAAQFSHLKKVKAKFREMYLPHSSFLRGLQASGAQLQDLSVSFRNHDQPYYQASILSFKSLVAESHKSLTRIEIINFWNIGDLTPIRRCRKLEQLVLEKEPLSVDAGFPFSAVLDDFPRLKQLKFANFYALLLEEDLDRTPRPLQSLTLCDTTVYTPLFDYIAAKCPNLNTLNVTDCRKIYDGQLQVTIDMPNHVFKSIIIEDLYLGLRSRNLFGRSDKSSTLVSLEETRNQPELSLEKKWYRQLLSRSKSPEKWYHVYRESSYNPLPLLQQIKGLHVRKIKKFKMTSKHWDQLSDADDLSYSYGPKKKWSLDIHRGYVSVRCKSVNQFTFQDINLE